MNKNRFLLFLSLLFLCLSQLRAENCLDCPMLLDGQGYKYRDHVAIGGMSPDKWFAQHWARFHCDQIRQLRSKVKEQEAKILSLETEIQQIREIIGY